MDLESTNHKKCYAAIILAGGRSARMGYPKPWLTIGNNTFMEQLIATYQDADIKNIVVVINQEFCKGEWATKIQSLPKSITVVENDNVDLGRLYSIKLGLEQLNPADFIYIQNVDNPLIDKKVIETLRKNNSPNGVSVPTYHGKGGHPILISNNVGDDIIHHFNTTDTLRDIINRFERKNVEVNDSTILTNLNTPSDYQEIVS